MSKLITAIEDFAQTWLANPEAKLEYARLIRRALDAEGRDAVAIIEWSRDEEKTARRLGVIS